VAKLGWSESGFRMIAGVHQPNVLKWIALWVDDNGDRYSAGTLDLDPWYVEKWNFNFVLGQQRFPFGYAVLPDHPA
jgi:hypothetical protein